MVTVTGKGPYPTPPNVCLSEACHAWPIDLWIWRSSRTVGALGCCFFFQGETQGGLVSRHLGKMGWMKWVISGYIYIYYIYTYNEWHLIWGQLRLILGPDLGPWFFYVSPITSPDGCEGLWDHIIKLWDCFLAQYHSTLSQGSGFVLGWG